MKFFIIVFFAACSLIIYANSYHLADEENIGKEVFNKTCHSCHTGGFKGWITGAPEIGYFDEWESYFKKDFEVIVKNVNEGTKGHAVNGDCETCTKEQIESAIKYIMTETKDENEE